MTVEEIRELGLEALETRTAEIAEEIKTADKEAIETLNAELDAIEERKTALNKEIEGKRQAAAAVATGAGQTIETRKETQTMTNKEIRNSKEYIEAYAKYVKTGKDAECRSLLTENVEDGVVPVPEFVEGKIRTAWEQDGVFSRVAKTFVKGNVKVGFEVSATDAAEHTEGAKEPDEEELILGVVNLVPGMIKKWITVSDEVLALAPETFLNYLYDEVANKIVKKAADITIAKIMDAPAESTTAKVGVAQIEGAVNTDTIIDAIAELGDEAQDLVIVASGKTIAAVKKAALAGNYAYDPFQGLTVIQKTGVEGAIVGDLKGVQANLPEGEAVTFKFDDLSLAEKDLVKIVGKQYAAIEVVGPKMLAVITGGESE